MITNYKHISGHLGVWIYTIIEQEKPREVIAADYDSILLQI